MTASTDRRSLFKLGLAGAAATLAAPQIMTRAASAQQAAAQLASDAFSRFTLGDFEITVVNDGARTVPEPQSIFGTDQSAETVGALLEDNFLPAERMQLGFAPTAVRTGSEVVLFDTGNGEGGREGGVGRTRERLAGAGIAPEDVTLVVLTHFHPDHIGGMTEGGEPAFPNARYAAGRAEYDFWLDAARAGTPAENGHQLAKQKVEPFAEAMTFVEDGGTVLPGITAMAAFGHTPGHMIFMLESGGRPLLLTADTANHFVLSLQRPDWEVRFDMDKAAAAATRKRVFDMVAAERMPFIGYHMPFPAAGYIETLDTGYRFVPESYQFDL